MGASVSRTCRSIWSFSTSRSVTGPGEPDHRGPIRDDLLLDGDDPEAEALRNEALEREQDDILAHLEHRREVHDKITSQMSVELTDLKSAIQQLSHDLNAPSGVLAPVSEDHQKPYTRLDDYVHETMYALLMWLSSKPDFRVLSMGQLMFFLKSHHVRQRKRYILTVERILRSVGLSVFERDQRVNAAELAVHFDVTEKRVSQSKEVDRLTQVKSRSKWHALE